MPARDPRRLRVLRGPGTPWAHSGRGPLPVSVSGFLSGNKSGPASAAEKAADVDMPGWARGLTSPKHRWGVRVQQGERTQATACWHRPGRWAPHPPMLAVRFPLPGVYKGGVAWPLPPEISLPPRLPPALGGRGLHAHYSLPAQKGYRGL